MDLWCEFVVRCLTWDYSGETVFVVLRRYVKRFGYKLSPIIEEHFCQLSPIGQINP